MDLIGPLPRSKCGNSWILVITDWFTKYVLIHPLRTATGPAITKYLDEFVFPIFGAPEIVMADNGKQFMGKHDEIQSAENLV